jgi:SPP1 family predicted phage head-tail adaptor
MQTQRLRHRIDIDERTLVEDPMGGSSLTWAPFATAVPAEVAPLSAREFLSANQTHGEVTARITIRWMDGLDATMRIRHGDTVYNIAGVLPDAKSGREHITLPVTAGVNEG